MMIDVDEFIKLSKKERQQHIDLLESCLERGGNSTNHRGILAQYLNSTIPTSRVILAHACNNGKCSNPKHLYWATDRENIVEDGKLFGTHKTIWDRTVEKYGKEEARRIVARNANQSKAGKGNKGKPKSEEHKRKISEALKKRNALVVELVDTLDSKSSS